MENNGQITENNGQTTENNGQTTENNGKNYAINNQSVHKPPETDLWCVLWSVMRVCVKPIRDNGGK